MLDPYCPGTFLKRYSFAGLSCSPQHGSISLQKHGYIRMIWSQSLLVDCQSLSEERFGLVILTLLSIEHRQIIEGFRPIGVIIPQCPLRDCKRTLIEWQGLSIFTLGSIQVCQTVEAGSNIR